MPVRVHYSDIHQLGVINAGYWASMQVFERETSDLLAAMLLEESLGILVSLKVHVVLVKSCPNVDLGVRHGDVLGNLRSGIVLQSKGCPFNQLRFLIQAKLLESRMVLVPLHAQIIVHGHDGVLEH